MAAKTKPATKRKPRASLGGVHADSAVLKDLLGLSGVTAAHTGKPLSEALCFGIAGGIASGYSHVAALAAAGLGSGVAFVGRHRQFVVDARWHSEFFRRLGVSALIVEDPNPAVAHANLLVGVKAKRSLIAWCSPVLFPHLSWTSTAGMYTLLVHAVDRRAQTALVSDCGPQAFKVSFEELASIRGRVNPLRNRVLVFDPPRTIERDALAAAAIAGIKACVFGSRDDEQRGHRFLTLREVAGFLAQHHHSQGWKALFPEGKLFLALADTYASIETAWNGGAFFRPLFADFLDEAAALSGRVALAKCAAAVRKLAKEWSALANAALPKRNAAFARTRELLGSIERTYRAKGRAADKAIVKSRAELAAIETKTIARFPLDGHAANRLLDELAERLERLASLEADVANDLRRAVR